MLVSATEHYQRQQRITAAGVLAARQARSNGLSQVVQVVTAYQLAAARDGADSVPLMLAEQGIDSDIVAGVAVTSLAGVASDGRSLAGLFSQADTDYAFDLMVATQLQDVARSASSLAMVSDLGTTGYVRMLNPPSCSRCAILAGKFYKWNTGFQRHPRCDCRHVPSRENLAGDLVTNPNRYFDSLSAAEQDRIFTQAGAQAIRDGADISQVVNARRGMFTAQIGGRTAQLTTEGTTARGLAGQTLGNLTKVSGQRYRRSQRPRLMPETIYSVATSREDAIRLLKLNGYLF